jgi:hypothetical protein
MTDKANYTTFGGLAHAEPALRQQQQLKFGQTKAAQ